VSQLRRDSSRHPAPEKPSIQENPSRAASETSAETFKNQHTGHKVECLIAAGERYFPTGQKEDPMAVAYIEVTNNHNRYLLRGARKGIEQPLQFAVVKGCLADAGFRLQVQEAALRKAMKRHFGGACAPFGDEKIDGFISLVREVVKEIDPGSVRVSGYSTTDSNIVYGQLGETEVNALIAKCGAQFEGAEVESIRRFVEAHRDTGDVLSVLMRRHIAIEQPAKSQ
jgi:hypothetical protein